MPLKIGVLCGDLSTNGGGVASAVVPLNRALCEGEDLQVVLLGRNGSWIEERSNLAVVDVGGRGAFGYSAELGRQLDRGDFDLIHTHGLWTYASVAAAAWRRRHGRPALVSPHGMLDRWALARSARKKKIARVLFEGRHMARVSCCHALTLPESDDARAWGYRGPVAIIPNGVELPAPAEMAGSGDVAAAGSKTLLFLGRIDPKKGVRELIEAWSLLQRERRLGGWWLVIAGWGEAAYVEALRRQVRDLGLDGSVAFPGPRFGEEKAATYAAADAFVLPSYSEGMPMAVLEAWSYGLPVLMTRACNLDVGFVRKAAVPVATDPALLAAAIGAFIARPARERWAFGEAGRRLVATEFTWPSVAGRLAEVYRWLAADGPPPACISTGEGDESRVPA